MFIVHRLGDGESPFYVTHCRNIQSPEEFDELYEQVKESINRQSESTNMAICGICMRNDADFKKHFYALQKASHRLLLDLLGLEFTDAFFEGMQDENHWGMPAMEAAISNVRQEDGDMNRLLERSEIYHLKAPVLSCIRKDPRSFSELIQIFRHYGRWTGMTARP
jgi:hypothetical protein